MIYEITRELDAEVSARTGVHVKYGSEKKTTTALTQTRIVLWREGVDRSRPPPVPQRNPQAFGARDIACVVRIYASATMTGAAEHDHERLLDQLIDAFDVALYKAVGRRKTSYSRPEWKRLTKEDLALFGLEQWAGVAREAEFTVARAELDLPKETRKIGAAPDDVPITSTTKVGLTDPPTEVAC